MAPALAPAVAGAAQLPLGALGPPESFSSVFAPSTYVVEISTEFRGGSCSYRCGVRSLLDNNKLFQFTTTSYAVPHESTQHFQTVSE